MKPHVSEAIVVLITAKDTTEATRIAEDLISAGLASCVQILPRVESIYRWEGAVQHETEALMFAKTLRGRFQELEEHVRGLHSYQVPEILALPVEAISSPYLKWLEERLESQPDTSKVLANNQ
jgi:periplasmic divalent cation tolerance protein